MNAAAYIVVQHPHGWGWRADVIFCCLAVPVVVFALVVLITTWGDA